MARAHHGAHGAHFLITQITQRATAASQPARAPEFARISACACLLLMASISLRSSRIYSHSYAYSRTLTQLALSSPHVPASVHKPHVSADFALANLRLHEAHVLEVVNGCHEAEGQLPGQTPIILPLGQFFPVARAHLVL